MSEANSGQELPARLRLYKSVDALFKSGIEEMMSKLEARTEFSDAEEKSIYNYRLDALKRGEDFLEVWLKASETIDLRGSSETVISNFYQDDDHSGTYNVFLEAVGDNGFELPKYEGFRSFSKYRHSHDSRMAWVVVGTEMAPFIVPHDTYKPFDLIDELKQKGEEIPYLSDNEATDMISLLQSSSVDVQFAIDYLDMDKRESPYS